MEYIDKKILKEIYPPRPDNSHKYDFGYLLIIGGSQLYSGSPALAAMAAMRAGVDLTLVISPERAANIIASFSPDLIAYPLKGHDIEPSHLSVLLSLTEGAKKVSKGKTAVVIGGGLGRDESVQETIRSYLTKIDIPAVIDADAIWAISPQKDILKKKQFVLTPHTYEFFVLSGINVDKLTLDEKIKVVKDFAREFETIILLKGNPDIITDGERVFLNKTGCPFLTVGGTGDTLAGITGALLARRKEPLKALSGAAYINGLAGELASKKLKEGVLATDLIRYIPEAIKR